jgi:tetratricopeptide (TPR) repeat protein
MGELLLLILVAGGVALAVAWPLLDGGGAAAAAEPDPEREAAAVRHRLALEALRDIEADHRAGSLDEVAYQAQRDEAEARAAQTLRALEATAPAEEATAPLERAPATEAVAPAAELTADDAPAPHPGGRSWRLPALVGALLALLLLAAFAAPPPFGIAERDARLERIRQLTDTIAANPRDVDALGELADLYLAGGSADDVARALASLILLRDAAPQSRDANQRLVTLLVRAGLWDDASAATDRYAQVVGDEDPDIPFLRGLIARGTGDNAEAVRQFDRFLEIAPDDPRAEMIRGLRDESAQTREGD